MVMAVAAIMFTSCNGNKTNANVEEPVDTLAVLEEEASVAADETVANLTEVLNGTDANKLQEALEAVKAKVAEFIAKNPEVAKEYVTKVQNFLNENADKVKALVGDNATVNAAVSALTSVSADDIVNNVNNFLSGAGNAAEGAVEGAKDAAGKAVENAKDAAAEKANEVVKDAKEKGAAAIDNAASKAKEKLGL